MPTHEDVPENEEGLYFGKLEYRNEYVFSNPAIPYDSEQTAINRFDSKFTESLECEQGFLYGSFDFHSIIDAEDDFQEYTETTTAGPDEVWTGTLTLSYIPDPGSSSGTFASTASYTYDQIIDNTWAYTSIGQFYLSSPGSGYTSYDDYVEYSEIKSTPYRFGIPEEYDRSTWEMEWDEVGATTEWWEWYDGGMVGTEPTPGPSLVTHRTWVWGGDTEEPWSPAYDPAGLSYAGEVRPVNVLTTCWKSTRIGTKPTASGAEVALPE